MQQGKDSFWLKRSWISFIATAKQQQPWPFNNSHQPGAVTFSLPAKHTRAGRSSSDSGLLPSLGNTIPAQDTCCSLGKPIIRCYQQSSSKPHWDIAVGATCKLNKYCNILVRQLHWMLPDINSLWRCVWSDGIQAAHITLRHLLGSCHDFLIYHVLGSLEHYFSWHYNHISSLSTKRCRNTQGQMVWALLPIQINTGTPRKAAAARSSSGAKYQFAT